MNYIGLELMIIITNDHYGLICWLLSLLINWLFGKKFLKNIEKHRHNYPESRVTHLQGLFCPTNGPNLKIVQLQSGNQEIFFFCKKTYLNNSWQFIFCQSTNWLPTNCFSTYTVLVLDSFIYNHYVLALMFVYMCTVCTYMYVL